MKLNTPRSPKFRRLMTMTGLGRAATAGTLELLWLFVMDQAPAGDIGKWSDQDIEAELDWNGKDGLLIESLIKARWLDQCEKHRLVIHDWTDHLPEFIKKKVGRGTITIALPVWTTADNGGQRRTTAADGGQRRIREGKGREGKGREEIESVKTTAAAVGCVSESGPPAAKPKKSICPDRLDEPDRQKLLAWAATRDFTESHVRWGFNRVKDWSQSKAETRADWVATIRNAMRDGWALKGYAETDSEKYNRELAASPLAGFDGDQPNAS